MVTNNVSEGSCVTQGGTASYKKKLKSLYIHTTKYPNRNKNLDYGYLLNKYNPKLQNLDVLFTSWMKNLIKIWKLNSWPKMFLSREEENGLIVKDP